MRERIEETNFGNRDALRAIGAFCAGAIANGLA